MHRARAASARFTLLRSALAMRVPHCHRVDQLRLMWPGATVGSPLTYVAAATSTWVWFVELGGRGLPPGVGGSHVLRVFRADQLTQATREIDLCSTLAELAYPVAQRTTPRKSDLSVYSLETFTLLATRPGSTTQCGVGFGPLVRGIGCGQRHRRWRQTMWSYAMATFIR
jgi:hypothetical protein